MAKVKKKSIVCFAVMFAIMALLVLHLTLNVNPIIEEVSEKEVKDLAIVAINSACDEILTEYPTLDIIDYLMDKDGNLQMVTTNTTLMNSITRKAIEASREKISAMGEQGVPIPLGSLSGITVLAGQGPDIYIKVYPLGAVNASFSSEFIAAGINQTRHRITLNVKAEVSVVMPGVDKVVNAEAQVLLCENLIIGKVPQSYFEMNSLGDLLNLVP